MRNIKIVIKKAQKTSIELLIFFVNYVKISVKKKVCTVELNFFTVQIIFSKIYAT